MKIIVVHSDTKTLWRLSGLILEAAPEAELCAFHNGKQALAHAMRHPADVVFLGMNLPGVHGLLLAGQLKALYPFINLVVLLDDHDEDRNIYCARRAFQLHASGGLTPPYTRELVERELKELRFSVR